MVKKFNYEYVSFEELYEAYLECRKKKRSSINALEFEVDETMNLYKLWYELNSKTYQIGKSIVFCVRKPVKREIFAADFRDRIIHHLLIRRINTILEENFIDDSYSCRVGKGTTYGIQRCSKFITEATEKFTKDAYIVKCDLKSFFMSIDKRLLFKKLKSFIEEKYQVKDERDKEFVLYLIELILFNEPQHNCIRKQSIHEWDDLPKDKSLFSCKKYFGMPIGNLTSQMFANFFLSEFDHYVTEDLGVKYYGRYVDDFFMVVNDKSIIHDLIEKCRTKLKELGVTLHPKKLYLQHVSKGVKFIGAVIKKDRLYIANRTKGSMYEKLKNYSIWLDEKLAMNEKPTTEEIENFVSSMNSYLGFMVHYKTYNIRKKILDSDLIKKWKEYCYVNDDYTKLTIFKDYSSVVGKKRRLSKHEHWEMERKKENNPPKSLTIDGSL